MAGSIYCDKLKVTMMDRQGNEENSETGLERNELDYANEKEQSKEIRDEKK